MKLDITTIALIGGAFLLLSRNGGAAGGGGQYDPGTFPPEPPKASSEWPRWVQIVIAIAGGLIPALFGKDGPFSGKKPEDIQAAAFGNVNPFTNFDGAAYWQNQPIYWGQTSPFYGG